MRPQSIIFAHNPQTQEVRMYGVRFYGQSHTDASHFKIFETNFSLEYLGNATRLEASGTRLEDALQKHLGQDWRILNRKDIFDSVQNTKQ